MAKKKAATEVSPETATTDATTTSPDLAPTNGHAAPPVSDTNGNGQHDAEPPTENGNANRPAQTFSYLVGKDTYVQTSVWEKTVNLRDGSQFVTHEITVRKRYKDAQGWQTLHSFRASELYALAHAIEQAEKWILETRRLVKEGCPF